MIIRHKVVNENGEDVLIVYLNNSLEEFADELGEDSTEREKNLITQVQEYIKNKGLKFSGKVVKVVVGALVVATLAIGVGHNINAEAKTVSNNQAYVVKEGDNLWNISRNLGISIADLKEINNLRSDIIHPGDTLFLTRNAEMGTYNVQTGDNLWTIARKYGMSVNELKTLNNLKSDVIHPGDKLQVVQAETPKMYTVKSGDSLWNIARGYNLSVSDLLAMNNLTTDVIQPGQTLRVTGKVNPSRSYTVKPGDNLWTIARVFDTTVDKLKVTNNLTTDIIQPGETLIIPDVSTPTPEAPVDKTMTINVRRSNGVIQNISLEEYVTGVVAAELGAGFNEASYKAQALAARTYAARRTEAGKTISDTDSHQVYLDRTQIRNSWGEHDFNKYYPLVEKAVNETKAEVIMHEGEYIDALYFSTSNGRTDMPEYVWGGKLDYLQSVDSHWDKRSPYFYLESTYTNGEFASRLGISTSSLYAEVVSRTANGSVNTINIGGRVFSGNYVKSRLGLRSTDFTIKFASGRVIIEQRGWGHAVGLSQYGAYFMGEEGYNYQQIIHHYYQGVDIVRI